MEKSKKNALKDTEDEVLRRMLNTPPKPHDKPEKKRPAKRKDEPNKKPA